MKIRAISLPACLSVFLLLAACATQPPPIPVQLFDDAVFTAPSEPVRADAIFELNDAMRAYVHGAIARQERDKGARRALFDALYNTHQLKVEYDSSMTRTAIQTFEARAGNCLSLVIMTAALAKEMDLQVQYQSVQTDPSWSRSGGLYFSAGHVNITLGRQAAEARNGYGRETGMTIDFLPPKDGENQRVQPIEEKTVRAMYLNNRAAEMLNLGQIDEAYWWARAAVGQDPDFAGAYNTLGVVYHQHGNLEQAQRVFALLLERAPSDTLVMSNLAQTLKKMGRKAEAGVLLRRLAQLQPEPPFYFFELGRKAMGERDYATARRMFLREMER
ncbi:MAG TPA: tetratricopeptide repeat protein, partial [Janthinobacterium sp.]|nr:tetratricopeptide repeat protein [Janthinobacterium sp.]